MGKRLGGASNFLLHIIPKDLKYEDWKMSYTDFLIRKEHKFFRNVYCPEDFPKLENLKDLKSYYFGFENILNIIIFNNIIDNDLNV